LLLLQLSIYSERIAKITGYWNRSPRAIRKLSLFNETTPTWKYFN
jgi:hypothetical protein